MNAFKRSDKPSHKLYSTSNPRKEFLTNKEFVLEVSGESVDLNHSFSELQNSFFSRDSSRIDRELLDQLKEFEKSAKEKSLVVEEIEKKEGVKRNKEEETNYTAKANFVKLENEEIQRNWFCEACIASDSPATGQSCVVF
jgi:hypothetical protein